MTPNQNTEEKSTAMHSDKTHVLLFPFPGQGHIPPMLNLAELLSGAGLLVTFLNTDHVHRRLSAAASDALDRFRRMPTFRFRTIPDGLPEDDPRTVGRLKDLEEAMRTTCRGLYREILVSGDEWPPVTCVVADGFLPLGLEVAEEVGVPTMILRTSSACSVWAYCNVSEMIKRGEIPFDDGDLEKKIESVKGMECFLRRRDLPSLIRQAKSTDDQILQFLMRISANLTRAQALIVNTIESVEAPVLTHIRSVCASTYTLGPLHALVNTERLPSSNFATLWQEDRTCLSWLDSQPPKSVVYISFGSIAVVSREDLIEFWHGLVDSGYQFLWVGRSDLIQGNEMSEEITAKRGRIVTWAPQQEVLAHPAVGCFLTHSGWNSILESIVSGVPMICWPVLADQQINSRFVSEVLGIGVDMKDMRGRTIVERMVREVMDGEGAEERRRSVEKMAKMAKESVEKEGSSYKDLRKLIQHIKSFTAQGK